MSGKAAHTSRWRISEVVFGVPFLAAIALQVVVPLSLPGGFLRVAFLAGGAALIVVGLAFIIRARREFAHQGQPTDPGHPTTRLVTTGVFSVSRNPIYLGAACFLAGLALAMDLPWVLLFLLPSLIACHYALIRPEERYLLARFGDEYRRYAGSVHRWIGRAALPRERTTPSS